MQLKPGVSQAYFWSVIGIGAASTAATALSLTTYAWAGMAGALIALIVGFWQANGPKGPPPGAQILIACLSLLSLSSCATTSAFLASPFGQATIQTADQLAKQVLVTTETLGLQQIIIQATAKLASLKAQGADPDAAKEALRIGQIGGYSGVIEAAQVKYEQLTGKRYSAPKQPVNVLPATAMREVPACLMASRELRHAATAANDAQGEPAMPPSPMPAMKQSAGGVSIPPYGAAVAAHLASAN